MKEFSFIEENFFRQIIVFALKWMRLTHKNLKTV